MRSSTVFCFVGAFAAVKSCASHFPDAPTRFAKSAATPAALCRSPSGFVPQPRPYMAARAMACADVAPPPLEGGQSMITVSANGTIEVE